MKLPFKPHILVNSMAAVVFACCGIAVSAYMSAPVHAEKQHPGEALYNSKLPTLAGPDKSLNEWRNKVLVVNFWATWCSPCVEEMPELSALQKELSQQHVQFIGVGVDSRDNIIPFSKKYHITYPLYAADMPGAQLARQLGDRTGGLPFTVILNKSGDIIKTYTGRLNMDELRRDIATAQH